MEILNLVKQMHIKFGIDCKKIDFTKEEKQFRYEAMLEEINEYLDADNKADELDAIVDLIVFALGTLERQGMLHIFKYAFKLVMQANIKKELGANLNKRGGFKLDLIKPEGWTAPDLTELIELKEKDIEFILVERKNNYGNFADNATFVQNIMATLSFSKTYYDEGMPVINETNHMIIHKLARIIFGNINYEDSYIDIIGYAKRCKEFLVDSKLQDSENSPNTNEVIKLTCEIIYPHLNNTHDDWIQKILLYVIGLTCEGKIEQKQKALNCIIFETEKILGKIKNDNV